MLVFRVRQLLSIPTFLLLLALVFVGSCGGSTTSVEKEATAPKEEKRAQPTDDKSDKKAEPTQKQQPKKAEKAKETKTDEKKTQSKKASGPSSTTKESSTEEDIKKAINEHYDALRSVREYFYDGGPEKAYSYYGPTFRSQQDFQSWKEKQRTVNKRTAETPTFILLGDVSENEATAAVDGTAADFCAGGCQNRNIPTVVHWNMVKEDGQWKLDEITSTTGPGFGD